MSSSRSNMDGELINDPMGLADDTGDGLVPGAPIVPGEDEASTDEEETDEKE